MTRKRNRVAAGLMATLATLMLVSICMAAPQPQDQAAVALNAAMDKEIVEGNLQAAIEQYRDIVKTHAASRAVAAKALMRMGQCYEKLGKVEARAAYERVLREYAEQPAAAEARARLAELQRAAPTTLITRRVWAGTAGTQIDTLGAPSPDGRFLSFVDWSTGDLAVRDLGSTENRRLTNKGTWNDSVEFAEFSVFSPDSKQIAYEWFNKDLFFELRLISVEGKASSPRVLYRNPDVDWVHVYDWSPDGKHILALLEKKTGGRSQFELGGTSQLVLISVADGAARELKDLGHAMMPYKMSFSPDGRDIVYDFPQKEDATERDIFIMAVDTGRSVPVVQHAANDLSPVWSPDGKWIVFVSDRTGSVASWVVRISGNKTAAPPELVKADLGSTAMPTALGFTRKGAFYYAAQVNVADVHIATIDPGTGKIVIPPAPAVPRLIGSHAAPVWSPDGRFLAYAPRRLFMQSRTLTIRSLESGQERTLAIDLVSFGGVDWSVDGRWLVGQGVDMKGRAGIFRVDAQSGQVTPVALNEADKSVYMQGLWTPDGKGVYCIRYSPSPDKFWAIVLRDVESGTEEEIFRAGPETTSGALPMIARFGLSPDGRKFVLLRSDFARQVTTLHLLPVSGGEPREIIRLQQPEMIAPYLPPVFSGDGKYVLLGKRRANDINTELWRASVNGGEPQKLDIAMEMLRDVRVHPDGRRIAFAGGQDKSEIWVMENFLPPLKNAK